MIAVKSIVPYATPSTASAQSGQTKSTSGASRHVADTGDSNPPPVTADRYCTFQPSPATQYTLTQSSVAAVRINCPASVKLPSQEKSVLTSTGVGAISQSLFVSTVVIQLIIPDCVSGHPGQHGHAPTPTQQHSTTARFFCRLTTGNPTQRLDTPHPRPDRICSRFAQPAHRNTRNPAPRFSTCGTRP